MSDAEALRRVEGLAPAVLVTGASRGIGRALADRFARAGHTVVLVARGADALAEAASAISRDRGVKVVPIALDITETGAPALLEDELRRRGLYADVLVNNAGVGLAGHFHEHTDTDIASLIAVNISATTQLMHHLLPGMLGRGRGGILNVASLGGMVPGPYQAAYYASKAYVISVTEAVAYEVRGRGVRIAVVAPGPVNTGFHRDMGAEGALYRTILPALSSEAVAGSGYRWFMLGRTKIVPGLLPALAALALKILPNIVTVPLVGLLLVKPSHPTNGEASGPGARR